MPTRNRLTIRTRLSATSSGTPIARAGSFSASGTEKASTAATNSAVGSRPSQPFPMLKLNSGELRESAPAVI
jgi:hypothetical protein